MVVKLGHEVWRWKNNTTLSLCLHILLRLYFCQKSCYGDLHSISKSYRSALQVELAQSRFQRKYQQMLFSMKCHHVLKDSLTRGFCIFIEPQNLRVRRDLKCHLFQPCSSLWRSYLALAGTTISRAFWGGPVVHLLLFHSWTDGPSTPSCCRIPVLCFQPSWLWANVHPLHVHSTLSCTPKPITLTFIKINYEHEDQTWKYPEHTKSLKPHKQN